MKYLILVLSMMLSNYACAGAIPSPIVGLLEKQIVPDMLYCENGNIIVRLGAGGLFSGITYEEVYDPDIACTGDRSDSEFFLKGNKQIDEDLQMLFLNLGVKAEQQIMAKQKKHHYFLISLAYKYNDQNHFGSMYSKQQNDFVSMLDLSQIKSNFVDFLLRDSNINIEESYIDIIGISKMGYMTEYEFEGQ